MADVKLKITLQHPYNASLIQVEELSAIWGLKIVKASTYHKDVDLTTTKEVFKRIFHVPVQEGDLEVPHVLAKSIARIQVITNVKKHQEKKRKVVERKPR